MPLSTRSPEAYTIAARPVRSTASTTSTCGRVSSQAPCAQAPTKRERLSGTSEAGGVILTSEGNGTLGGWAPAGPAAADPSAPAMIAQITVAHTRGRVVIRALLREPLGLESANHPPTSAPGQVPDDRF